MNMMEYERINGNGNGNGMFYDSEERENGEKLESLKGFPLSSSSASSSPSPARYIEHHVTKLDTLAGIAIRYGVEVADIKKMNGLVTDLQMFALKTLHIPLPGRHPPSPCLSNGHVSSGETSSQLTPPRRMRFDFLDSFQSLRPTPERRVSPAMNYLQGYYGLHGEGESSRGCELAVYGRGNSSNCENEAFTTPSSLMNTPLSHHRRSRSLANGFKTEEHDPADDAGTNVDKWIQNLNLRREKSETDFSRTPEKVLKEENGSGGWFSAITGKGLALRTKAASRTNLAAEGEASGVNGFATTLGASATESSSGVRKSPSTSSLQDQENVSSSSIWSTSKWSALKPDLQAALGKPIFDGLPKPISGRKAKAALD